MELPAAIGRKAIVQHFTRTSEARWVYFFHNEKINGLYELRVKGPRKWPYYDTKKLIDWLIGIGDYRVCDFRPASPITPALGLWGTPVVHTHRLEG